MSSLILTGVICVYLLICVGIACLRGLSRSRMNGIAVILSAGLAVGFVLYLQAQLSDPALLDEVMVSLKDNAVLDGETYSQIEDLLAYPSVAQTLVGCVSALILPFVAIVLFLVVRLVLRFISLILAIILRKKMKAHNKKAKLGALRKILWGVAGGLIAIFVFIIPVSIVSESAGPILNAVDELAGDSIDPAMMDEAKSVMEELNSSVPLTVYRAVGVKAISDKMTTFTVGEDSTTLGAEIEPISALVADAMELGNAEDGKFGPEQAPVFRHISEMFGESVILKNLVSDIAGDMFEKWSNGEDFMGISAASFDLGEDMKEFTDTLWTILKNDSKDVDLLTEDMDSLLEILAVLSENDVFAKLESDDENALMNALGDEKVIGDLTTVLLSNARLATLKDCIYNIAMKAIASAIGLPEDMGEIYETFSNDAVEILNRAVEMSEEERVEFVSNELLPVFNEAGIEVDPALIDTYAASMVTDLVEKAAERGTPITKDDFAAFFEVYALANAENSETPADDGSVAAWTKLSFEDLGGALAGTIYEGLTADQLRQTGASVLMKVTKLLTEMDPESEISIADQAKAIITEAYVELLGESSPILSKIAEVKITAVPAAKVLTNTAALKSAETMEENDVSVLVTLDKLMTAIDPAGKELTDDQIAKEVDSFKSMFGAATDILGKDMESMSITELASTVGGILDALSTSDSFGSEKTGDLFKAVLQSDMVKDATGIDPMTASRMAEAATGTGNINYADTFGSVADSIEMVSGLESGEGLTPENIAKTIKNLTPETAAMIQEFITADRMKEYNVPEEYAEVSATLIYEIFEYMKTADGLSDEQYQKEADAIGQTLDVVMASRDNASGDAKNLFGDVLPTPETVVDSFMTSGAIRAALIKTFTKDGEVIAEKMDIFEVGVNASAEDQTNFNNAAAAYLNAHNDPETKLALKALSAMLGVPVTLD